MTLTQPHVETALPVPAFVRGQLVQAREVVYPARGGRQALACPDPVALLPRLVLAEPASLPRDFAPLTTEDVIAFLDAASRALDLDRNPYLQEALGLLVQTSELTPSILEACYRRIALQFHADVTRAMVENEVGSRFLDGWVDVPVPEGRARVRAYGARTLHVLAGNVPEVAAVSIVRGALTRGDNLLKLPANDPFTAVAILRTLAQVDARHPVVRHAAAAYWPGGLAAVERPLLTPRNLEKVVAWGGEAAIRHLRAHIGPGIDVVTLDPKSSVSIVGHEAFADEATLREVATRAARDAGAYNQEACVAARIQVVHGNPEQARRFGREVYTRMREVDPGLSTRPRTFDPALRASLDSLRGLEEFYDVTGGEDGEGAVVTCLTGDAVEFFPRCRTVIVVPVERPEQALEHVTAATQTVGIWPEALKDRLVDGLVARGAQRLVSLGRAAQGLVAVPHDALEPMRRTLKWIVDESA